MRANRRASSSAGPQAVLDVASATRLTSQLSDERARMGQFRSYPAFVTALAPGMPINTAALSPSSARVAHAVKLAGLVTSIVEMAETTRTAEEAARACGCEPAQIVKSLIFRGRETG